MAGFMNSIGNDAAYRQVQESDSTKISNRTFYRSDLMRGDSSCRLLGGSNVRPTRSGPITPAQVSHDSFMHGRASVLNGGERSTQAFLPSKAGSACPSTDLCKRVDLERTETRDPKFNRNIIEADRTGFSMFPENQKPSYHGVNAITGIHVQTRLMQPAVPAAVQCPPKNSYGNYTTSTLAQYS